MNLLRNPFIEPKAAIMRFRRTLITSVFGALVATASVVVVSIPAQAAAPWCRPWAFVGVPGSGQGIQHNASDPWGPEVSSIRANFVMQRGDANVMKFPVNYPATFDHNMLHAVSTYNDSKDAGVRETKRIMEVVHRECPDARIVLAGFSQGAHVASDVINSAGWAPRAKVHRVALIGSPRYDKRSGASVPVGAGGYWVGQGLFGPHWIWSSETFDAYAEPKTKDVCILDDWACDPGTSPLGAYDSPHNKYTSRLFPGAGSITITRWLGKYWLGGA